MKKILALGLALITLTGIMPAYADDITAAQMIQIDQSGTRNNMDITSGTINQVDTITTMGTLGTATYLGTLHLLDVATEIEHITNMDLLDEITHITNMDSLDELTHITNMDSLDEVAHITTVDTLTSLTLGNMRLQDGSGSGKATIENGALWVKSGAEVGTAKSMYAVSTAVAANTEIEAASYTVTTAKTLYISNVSLVASGLATLRVLAGSTEIARSMTTPACQTAINPKYQAVSVAAGTVISLRVKNREASAMDIVSSLEGSEK